MISFKTFPKYDARRYFLALLAVDRMKDRATLHYISLEIECTRAEVQRALESSVVQYGIEFVKLGPLYRIVSWGVLKKPALEQLIYPEIN